MTRKYKTYLVTASPPARPLAGAGVGQGVGGATLTNTAGGGGPQFTDDFSSGDLSKVQSGISWASSTNAAVYTGFGRSGNNCLRFTFAGGAAGSDSFAEQRFDLGAGSNYTNVTIEWWAYYPDGTEGLGPKFVHRSDSPGNNKLFRLWKGNRGDGNNGYSSYYHKHGASSDRSANVAGDERAYLEWSDGGEVDSNGSHYNTSAARGVENFITDAHRGRWIQIKCVNRSATIPYTSLPSDGIIEVWRDGTRVMNGTTIDSYTWANPTQNGFDFGYLMGWANSGFLQTTYLYIDDVSITVS
jgi:hypothetical protein